MSRQTHRFRRHRSSKPMSVSLIVLVLSLLLLAAIPTSVAHPLSEVATPASEGDLANIRSIKDINRRDEYVELDEEEERERLNGPTINRTLIHANGAGSAAFVPHVAVILSPTSLARTAIPMPTEKQALDIGLMDSDCACGEHHDNEESTPKAPTEPPNPAIRKLKLPTNLDTYFNVWLDCEVKPLD
ncbi:hypothetical protein BGZ68_008979 [Mortierella alpina]|nr:hypothetical protein BGZ68_008979 [Mortierella alpina]